MTESYEMYLETILILSEENNKVRSIDIAKKMKFSRASVSVAIHKLENNKYLKINDDDTITLLKKGMDIATKIYERHTVISQLLMSIGVNEKTASKDACKIEHDISSESFDRLCAFVNNCGVLQKNGKSECKHDK